MYNPGPNSRQTIRRRIIPLSIVGVILLGIYFLLPRTQDKLATPALERNTQNTMRENDVSTLASGFASYLNEHQGSAPQTIQGDGAKTVLLCEASCNNAGSATVTLNYYQATPSAIQYLDYATDITAPDTSTIYIVKEAECNSDRSGLGSHTTDYAAVAFLFKIQAGSGEQQKCVGL